MPDEHISVGEESSPGDRLTQKRWLFCKNYINNGYNATQAYKDAGFSQNGAGPSAAKLLTLSIIQDTIKELEQDRLEALKITGEKVIKGIVRLAGKAENAKDYNAALKAHDMLGRGKLWEKGGGGIKNIETKSDGSVNINFEEDV